MFIYSFEGRWVDRPFWHSGFTLVDNDDLDRLHSSVIDAVVIDTDKGASPKAGYGRARKRPPPPTNPVSAKALRAISRSKCAFIHIAEDIRAGRPIIAENLAPLIIDLLREVECNASAVLGILRLKSRDEYTYLHSVAVSALMMNLARTMGIKEPELIDLGIAGLLHDSGKIGIPNAILNKPSALTDAEFDVMRTHPLRGHALLQRASGVPAIALDVVRHHHERIDGRGYPDRLQREMISSAARMGAVCDVYDALTSDRPYKDAWTPNQALLRMTEWQGQFDPAIFGAFMQSLGIFPVGTLVRVRESTLAVVIADNPSEPACPTVRSFYSIARRHRLAPEDVAIRTPGILFYEDPAHWRLGDWAELSSELLEDRLALVRAAGK